MKYVDKVYSHRKRFFEYLCCLKLLKYCTSCDFKKNSDVRPGQACVWWTRPTETNVKRAG